MKRPSKPNLEEERAIKEESRCIGWHEYQIAYDARRFVPVCDEADTARLTIRFTHCTTDQELNCKHDFIDCPHHSLGWGG